MTAESTTVNGRKITPMLRQYLDAKSECPQGAILLFRMGDFYEMFFEDAEVAAPVLEIALTARDKGDNPIPMAGVPHHSVSSYLARLVDKGYTVAICDQVEDPKKAKGLVKREITRVVTPGTVSDLEALDPGSRSYLALVCVHTHGGARATLALLDLLAGELLVTQLDTAVLSDELRRVGARELLVAQEQREEVVRALGDLAIPVRSAPNDGRSERERRAHLVDRFGELPPTGLGAADAVEGRWAISSLLTFAESTQRRRLRHLRMPKSYRISDHLMLDEATRRNLELCHTQLDSTRKGSLLWLLDHTRTAVGARLLSHWLLFPLKDKAAIGRRLDCVEALVTDRPLRASLHEGLKEVRDVERLVGRVAIGRVSPRDLACLWRSLEQVPALRASLKAHASPLGRSWAAIDAVDDLREHLGAALEEEPPLSATDGGIFKRGFCAELDELITMATEGHDFLSDLEQRERRRTGIGNLKVRFNRVFGYYIEITRANLKSVPADYVRKQTLVNAERFITEELKRHEDQVLNADERRKTRELAMFEALAERVSEAVSRLMALSGLLAETDALASLAQAADEGRYVRPTMVDEPVLELVDSRHPVVEKLRPEGERFVPNTVRLDTDEQQLMVLTGPNMAGKSTVMRQVALCTILAHMGSFVPARRARIGVCDRVFTRVGAADNLGRGQSTFMVEMIETGTILEHATRHSLVLLDEIGRGTSTFDGVSLAWAVAEALHDEIGCRAMFATHYHELTDLALERPRIVNASVAVKEHNDKIVFLRELTEGPANRSYGIQVARLAGLPEAVLQRAREILANLERGELDERGMPALSWSPSRRSAGQLPLFAPPRPPPEPGPASCGEVERRLRELDVMNMTPIEALTALDRLKSMLEGGGDTPPVVIGGNTDAAEATVRP